ncbi:ABC transporter substrate-binding protein [Kineococcus indalonis]|uniref:ABC transporter substrate-binding protein n=1 Tax=Kineococcus indalonis TaxID=2696566 RepID=UPI002B1BE3EA|nr:extracellular solute-binding protein [Kineococcus indalonis]
MDQKRTSRRSFLTLAMATPLAASALAACGGSSGPGQAADGGATIWFLTGQPKEDVRNQSVDSFNESSEAGDLTVAAYQNDAYKTKIRTAIGAGQAPTLIFSWGGGSVRDWAEAGQIEDLTSFVDENPEMRERLFEAAWSPGEVDGKIYAVPHETVQPVFLYYNKKLFSQIGAQPPATWDDLMALVPQFRAAGIAPISLAGQSRWTTMMWLEFLVQRVAGTEAYQAINNSEPNAWSNPDVLRAFSLAQDLVNAGGFVDGFNSVVADQNADQALLYTDKAAMLLQGSWCFGSIKADGGDFVSGGNLGYQSFPVVTGGKGDGESTVGNPAQYYSISSKASEEQKQIARDYLANGVLTDEIATAFINEAGEVPIVNGIDDQLAAAEDGEFLSFIYDIASNAPFFGMSWDQALSPTAAEELLTNIEQLFGNPGGFTPQQFADNMNAVSQQ